jgi:rhodanese-related sulfurtransferase
MFTAIVVCMLLLAWTSALGLLDLERIWVNPTWLGSGILGGILLGFGFIIGGYCPGTSIVSAATLKVDGMIFLGGVGLGAFVFGETAPAYKLFWDTAGRMGRVTLPEWMGISYGATVILVVLLAFAMFLFFERMERIFGAASATDAPSRSRPWLVGGAAVAGVALATALPLPAIGQPTVSDRVERERAATDAEIASRKFHIDPLEMLGLMHQKVQGKPGRMHLVLIDVRSESDFNRFHLVDAERWTLDELRGERGRALLSERAEKSIKVVMSNDEAAANEAFRVLRARGAPNLYVLGGGMNLWIERFRNGNWQAEPASNGTDGMRFDVDAALGSRHPEARPPLPEYERLIREKVRPEEYKVEPVVDAPEASGGCG